MANEVYFDPLVGGDGSRITDDDNPNTGLANGGAVIRIVPMFQQVVNVAKWVATQASGILADASAAAASAAAALASQNAAATSVTQVNTLGAATGLQTTGAAVTVNAASPPTAGQVLKVTSPTTATWQADAATSNLKLYYLQGA